MRFGCEWVVDAEGCSPTALADVDVLRTLFARLIGDLDLHPVDEARFHVFPPPGGITGFVILSESHLACHTYPEHGVATINLYCCRPRPEWAWSQRLAEILGAAGVRVREIARVEEVVTWP